MNQVEKTAKWISTLFTVDDLKLPDREFIQVLAARMLAEVEKFEHQQKVKAYRLRRQRERMAYARRFRWE